MWESFTDILWILYFDCNYLNKILENISKEQKSIFLLGDFNVNVLNYNEYNPTNELFDSFVSNSFIPLILQPTRIASHSNTRIDNVCANVIDPDIIWSNLTVTIFYHVPQFVIIPNMFGNISGNKYNAKETCRNMIEKILFFYSQPKCI